MQYIYYIFIGFLIIFLKNYVGIINIINKFIYRENKKSRHISLWRTRGGNIEIIILYGEILIYGEIEKIIKSKNITKYRKMILIKVYGDFGSK